MDDDQEVPDSVELERLAKKWGVWLESDLKHFIRPLAEASGLSIQEVLLFVMSERIGQVLDQGIHAHLTIHHPPSDDNEEEWKK